MPVSAPPESAPMTAASSTTNDNNSVPQTPEAIVDSVKPEEQAGLKQEMGMGDPTFVIPPEQEEEVTVLEPAKEATQFDVGVG